MESFHWSPAQGSAIMHFAISATSGPTGPTRPMLPFIFAASDSVTLMLFHDAVYMAVKGAAAKLVRVVPPNRVGSARDQLLGRFHAAMVTFPAPRWPSLASHCRACPAIRGRSPE